MWAIMLSVEAFDKIGQRNISKKIAAGGMLLESLFIFGDAEANSNSRGIVVISTVYVSCWQSASPLAQVLKAEDRVAIDSR